MKQLITAIFLFALTNVAYADRIDNYCDNTGHYCGYQNVQERQTHRIRHHHKTARAIAHKEKSPKAVQVANIGNEPLGEPPRASSGLLAKAEQYLGQTARQVGVRSTLWCSAFLRKLTHASGVDDRAISWLSKPHIIARIGAIAVMRHHIGIVKSFDRSGNPIIISGNHGHKVGIGVYSKHRILAYVSA